MFIEHKKEPKIKELKKKDCACQAVTAEYGRITFYGTCGKTAKYLVDGKFKICGIHKQQILKHGEVRIKIGRSVVGGAKFETHEWIPRRAAKNKREQEKYEAERAKEKRRRHHWVALDYGITLEELDKAVVLYKKRRKKKCLSKTSKRKRKP